MYFYNPDPGPLSTDCFGQMLTCGASAKWTVLELFTWSRALMFWTMGALVRRDDRPLSAFIRVMLCVCVCSGRGGAPGHLMVALLLRMQYESRISHHIPNRHPPSVVMFLSPPAYSKCSSLSLQLPTWSAEPDVLEPPHIWMLGCVYHRQSPN